jgi:hypothetical protein
LVGGSGSSGGNASSVGVKVPSSSTPNVATAKPTAALNPSSTPAGRTRTLSNSSYHGAGYSSGAGSVPGSGNINTPLQLQTSTIQTPISTPLSASGSHQHQTTREQLVSHHRDVPVLQQNNPQLYQQHNPLYQEQLQPQQHLQYQPLALNLIREGNNLNLRKFHLNNSSTNTHSNPHNYIPTIRPSAASTSRFRASQPWSSWFATLLIPNHQSRSTRNDRSYFQSPSQRPGDQDHLLGTQNYNYNYNFRPATQSYFKSCASSFMSCCPRPLSQSLSKLICTPFRILCLLLLIFTFAVPFFIPPSPITVPSISPRLPTHIQPVGYRLNLIVHPHLRPYNGSITIHFKLLSVSHNITFHSKGLSINNISLESPKGLTMEPRIIDSEGADRVVLRFRDALEMDDDFSNDSFTIMKREAERDVWKLRMNFQGVMGHRSNNGFYRYEFFLLYCFFYSYSN